MKKKFLFSAIVVGAVMMSCQKEDSDSNVVDQNDLTKVTLTKDDSAKINFLTSEYPFSLANIKVLDNVIVAEDDIAFERSNFWSLYKAPQDTTSKLKRHYKQTNTVTAISSISVRVLAGVSSNWANAIADASNAWNGLGGRISFYPMSSTVETTTGINVRFGSIINSNGTPNTTIVAQGYYLTSGYPGKYITINSNIVDNFTSAERLKYMIHEMGHCIGFFHTDGSDGTLISGLSDSNISDPTSVMRQGQVAWAGFSAADKEAFYKYYKK